MKRRVGGGRPGGGLHELYYMPSPHSKLACPPSSSLSQRLWIGHSWLEGYSELGNREILPKHTLVTGQASHALDANSNHIHTCIPAKKKRVPHGKQKHTIMMRRRGRVLHTDVVCDRRESGHMPCGWRPDGRRCWRGIQEPTHISLAPSQTLYSSNVASLVFFSTDFGPNDANDGGGRTVPGTP